ncbi:MAG TPA: hypothetical protein VIM41_00965, partial [Gammaproteobacteria bacterium]
MKRKITGILLGLFIFSFSALSYADTVKKTVAAVHTEMQQLKGKQIEVRGKVVKVNNGIMKRNFLHIQDGSGKDGT